MLMTINKEDTKEYNTLTKKKKTIAYGVLQSINIKDEYQ